jgi:deoxyribonuclease-4
MSTFIKRAQVQRLLVGAHLSRKGGLLEIFKQAKDLGITVASCFTGNKLAYDRNIEIDPELITAFHSYLRDYQVFSHAGYLINLANKEKRENFQKSKKCLEAEIIRCQKLGIRGFALHPGSYPDRKEGIQNIAEAINSIEVVTRGSTTVCIELSAGQGSALPKTFEEAQDLYKLLSPAIRPFIRFAFDTCHIFAAGYDISTKKGVDKVLLEWDRVLGIETISLIHLNDSVFSCGSCRDRHQSLGKGLIGKEGMGAFIYDKRLAHIPKILETPMTHYLDWQKDLDFIEDFNG